MEILSHYLHQGLSFIVPLVILLGLLIFVHELGHFLVAKYFGVKVEVFSLGFGKKIFKYRHGETDYCLSLIPFGGYVKMYGDDPTVDVPTEERNRSFTHKPVGQRIAVVLAGPIMNFFFALLLFTVIARVGEETVKPVVGDLSVQSQAYKMGLRAGDTILAVNQQAVISWEQIQDSVEKNADRPLALDVERVGGERISLQGRTQVVPNKNILSRVAEIGELEGLSFNTLASTVGVPNQKSAASQIGLKTGDLITAVNGQSVERWHDLVKSIDDNRLKDELKLSVSRLEDGKKDENKFEVTLKLHGLGALRNEELASQLGFERPDLFISNVVEGSAAAQAGIKKGDKLISLNQISIDDWSTLVQAVHNYKEGDAPLNLVVSRDGEKKTFALTPKLISQPTPSGHDEKVFALGVVAGAGSAMPKTFLLKHESMGEAFTRGLSQTMHWTEITALSFLRLVQNKVSAKSIGGPIMIGQLASRTFEIGLSPFLKIMAIISINLFILNLLPIPVLDGGHLVFFIIEALRGAPLSVRKIEIAQQVGLVLLMGLMIFALFNDVTRLFN